MLEAKEFGFAGTGGVAVAPFRDFWSVAGDGETLSGLLRVVLPKPGKSLLVGGVRYLWAGADAWMVMGEGAEDLLRSVKGFGAVTDQSDGRVVFLVGGERVRWWLRKLVPLDLERFGEDDVAMTLAGHVPVMVWREEGRFGVSCFRSYAGVVYEALVEAAW